MLQRIYVDNYKRLVNFELPLQELSLLLGRNGVGKTAVLDVLFGVRRLLSGTARITDADAFPTRTLTRWQERDLQAFEFDVVLGEESYRYRLEVEHERATRLARVHQEELSSHGKPLFKCDLGRVQLYRTTTRRVRSTRWTGRNRRWPELRRGATTGASHDSVTS